MGDTLYSKKLVVSNVFSDKQNIIDINSNVIISGPESHALGKIKISGLGPSTNDKSLTSVGSDLYWNGSVLSIAERKWQGTDDIYHNEGNVGIGSSFGVSSLPTSKLEVRGNVYIESNVTIGSNIKIFSNTFC